MNQVTGYFCTDNRIPVSVFYPINESKEAVRKAKSYCDQCEMRKACRDEAITLRIKDGIWGGMTYEDRNMYLRQEAFRARRDSVLQQSTLHVQQHPVYVNPSSLFDTLPEQNHTQQALLSAVVDGSFSPPNSQVS